MYQEMKKFSLLRLRDSLTILAEPDNFCEVGSKTSVVLKVKHDTLVLRNHQMGTVEGLAVVFEVPLFVLWWVGTYSTMKPSNYNVPNNVVISFSASRKVLF